MERSQLRLLRSIVFNVPQRCRRCQPQARHLRTAHSSRKDQDADIQLEAITPTSKPKPQSSPYQREIAPSRLDENFVPKPLGAPIGMLYPPQAGEDAVKTSPPKQKQKLSEWHRAQREKLAKEFGTSYFKDFRNLTYRNGKFYIANTRLFKESASLFFPNLRGHMPSHDARRNWFSRKVVQEDTTNILRGKISVVSVFSRLWALNQTLTFVGDKDAKNPDLEKLIKENPGVVQMVQLNFEDQSLFYATLRMAILPSQASVGNYFMLNGIPSEIKDALAMMNDKVGYVFLVDQTCRIRWAACGDANEEEKVSLVNGVKRLVDNATRK